MSPVGDYLSHSDSHFSFVLPEEATIRAAASECKSLFPQPQHLRLAFLIPGILRPEKSLHQVSVSEALDTFRINTLGPLLLAKYFSPFLPRKSQAPEPPGDGTLPDPSVIAIMSARVGSVSDNQLGGWFTYRASKAGVNSIVKSIDISLRQRCGDHATCIALHPGTVKTELSKDFWSSTPNEKLFDPAFAAEKLLRVVQQVGLDGRGRCWDWKGEEILP